MMTINNKLRPIFITGFGADAPGTSLLRASVVAHMF